MRQKSREQNSLPQAHFVVPEIHSFLSFFCWPLNTAALVLNFNMSSGGDKNIQIKATLASGMDVGLTHGQSVHCISPSCHVVALGRDT